MNLKALPLVKIFICLNILVFLDYDFYPFPLALLLLYLVFCSKDISITKYEKIVINLQVFLFLVFFRTIPIIFDKYFSIWNKIFQHNYLLSNGKIIPENIFEDLQIVLFSISCNSTANNTLSIYPMRFSGRVVSDSNLTCPFDIPYGYALKYFNINSAYVWPVTLFISVLILLLLFKIYIDQIKRSNGKNIILIAGLFLSPPINFITQRMNIDLVIFIILYYLYQNKNINTFVKSLVISLISLLKFYPIIILFSEFLVKILGKKFKDSYWYLIFGLSSLYYFFFYESNLNSINFFIKTTESNRAYGFINDSLYLSQLFQININVTSMILILLIVFFLYLIRSKSFFKISELDFHFLVMFLGLSLFVNYDYRLIFLFTLINSAVSIKNKYFTSVFIVFIFSSPTLLHSYTKYFRLVENDQLYYFDFSFYFFIAITIKSLFDFVYPLLINRKL